MRLEHVMSREAVQVGRSEAIVNVAATMRKHGVSSVLVCEDDGMLVGILTERDLAHKIVAEGLAPEGLCAGDFMTPNPITADSRDRVWEGARLMSEHGVHHLPVTKEGRIVGIVSSVDLSGMQVAPVATQEVIRGLEESSREQTVEIPVGVGAGDLGEIIPAWY